MSGEAEKLKQDIDDAERHVNQVIGVKPDAQVVSEACLTALQSFCNTIEGLALHDISLLKAANAESRLWAAYTRINSIYRKRLAQLRTQIPTRPVETRKFTKTYLELLKHASRWYRKYIATLDRRYGRIPALQQIAGEFQSAVVTPASPAHRAQSLQSCYNALVYLGDLARWRATEKLDKDISWGPAMGYYELATVLEPNRGEAFHQQSIVEQAGKDHFRAVYHLYRSIMVLETFQNGLANLEIQMRSLQRKWLTTELSPKADSQNPDSSRRVLIAWFLRLHSLCYTGQPITGHDELEAEILTHLNAEVRRPDCTSLLLKVVLINISAIATSLLRLKAATGTSASLIVKAFNHQLRLSVKIFSLLIRIMTKEMQSAQRVQQPRPASLSNDNDVLTAQLTPTTKVILPAIRLYTRWLLATYQFLLPRNLQDATLAPVVEDLWATLTDVVAVATEKGVIEKLPDLSYLVDEDVDVIGFQPLTTEMTKKAWYDEAGELRLKCTNPLVQRLTPDQEMLARIKEMVIDCLRLAQEEATPLHVNKGRLTCDYSSQIGFVTTIVQPQVPALPQTSKQSASQSTKQSSTDTRPNAINTPRMNMNGDQYQDLSPVENLRRPPIKHTDAIEERCGRMVDDLVGADESPRPNSRPMSRLDDFIDVSDISETPSSFYPTPPTGRTGPGVERLQQGSLFQSGDQQPYASSMHSPLLFGRGGLWSTTPTRSRSVVNQTPPNGQGQRPAG